MKKVLLFISFLSVVFLGAIFVPFAAQADYQTKYGQYDHSPIKGTLKINTPKAGETFKPGDTVTLTWPDIINESETLLAPGTFLRSITRYVYYQVVLTSPSRWDDSSVGTSWSALMTPPCDVYSNEKGCSLAADAAGSFKFKLPQDAPNGKVFINLILYTRENHIPALVSREINVVSAQTSKLNLVPNYGGKGDMITVQGSNFPASGNIVHLTGSKPSSFYIKHTVDIPATRVDANTLKFKIPDLSSYDFQGSKASVTVNNKVDSDTLTLMVGDVGSYTKIPALAFAPVLEMSNGTPRVNLTQGLGVCDRYNSLSSYEFERSTDQVNWITVKEFDGLFGGAFGEAFDNSVAPGITYYYRMHCYNGTSEIYSNNSRTVSIAIPGTVSSTPSSVDDDLNITVRPSTSSESKYVDVSNGSKGPIIMQWAGAIDVSWNLPANTTCKIVLPNTSYTSTVWNYSATSSRIYDQEARLTQDVQKNYILQCTYNNRTYTAATIPIIFKSATAIISKPADAPQSTIDLKVNGKSSDTVSIGDTFSLSWTLPTGSACYSSWTPGQALTQNSSATLDSSAIGAGKTKVFSLNCTTSSGSSLSKSVAVTVNSAAVQQQSVTTAQNTQNTLSAPNAEQPAAQNTSNTLGAPAVNTLSAPVASSGSTASASNNTANTINTTNITSTSNTTAGASSQTASSQSSSSASSASQTNSNQTPSSNSTSAPIANSSSSNISNTAAQNSSQTVTSQSSSNTASNQPVAPAVQPLSVDFRVNNKYSETITSGTSFTLSWTVSGASSCNASWVGPVSPQSGTFIVNSIFMTQASQVYTLTCSNSSGSSLPKSVSVNISNPTPAQVSPTTPAPVVPTSAPVAPATNSTQTAPINFGFNQSSTSNTNTTPVSAPQTPIPTPNLVSATAQLAFGSSHLVFVQWTNIPTNISGVVVERSTDRVNWTELYRVQGRGLNYNDQTAVKGTQYYYRIKYFISSSPITYSPYSAVVAATVLGVSGPAAPVKKYDGTGIQIFTAPAVGLPMPTMVSASRNAFGAVVLNWTNNSTRVWGISIERSLDKVAWTEITKIAGAVQSYIDPNSYSRVKYYYRIRTFDGTASAPGNFSPYSSIMGSDGVTSASLQTNSDNIASVLQAVKFLLEQIKVGLI